MLYANCRVLVAGEATLEVDQFVALNNDDCEHSARGELLDGLAVDDEMGTGRPLSTGLPGLPGSCPDRVAVSG